MLEQNINLHELTEKYRSAANLLDRGYLVPVFSGGPGGGKSTLASKIAALLNVPIIAAGSILRDKHKMLYPQETVTFEDWYATLRGGDVKTLNDEIKIAFESGSVIGESRWVGHLDPSKCLFIFVDADVSIKAERLAKDKNRTDYYGKTAREIYQILKRRSVDEVKIIGELAQMYGISNAYDYREPKHYHLVIDSGTLTLEEEVAQVQTLLKRQPAAEVSVKIA